MNLSPQAEAALWATAALIAVLSLLCFGPPAWDAFRAGQYRRETARIQAAARGSTPVSRWLGVGELIGELITWVGYWVAVKVLRLDRTEAKP